MLQKQCLDNRYISNSELLAEELMTWEKNRNAARTKVNWMFAIDDARKKMGHLYPKLLKTLEHHVESTIAIA